MWMLRRIEAQGADIFDLKDIYEKQIRSVLEFGAPVFTAGLTGEDEINIERVQNTTAHVIQDQNYTPYKDALETLGLDSLKERRLQICTTFALNAYKQPKFTSWFIKDEKNENVRERKCKPVKEEQFSKSVKCRTKRYRKSPIPFLTNLIKKRSHTNMYKWIMAHPSTGLTLTVTPIPVINDSDHC